MALVSPDRIAAVLGLDPAPRSFAELDARVAEGLPKSALRASLERMCRNGEERRALMYRIVPEATYKRRRERLNAQESERAERLARVYATALYVWDSVEDAQNFLHTPHALLQGRPPIEVALTELGARRVEELLWRLCYGIAA